MAKPYMDYTGPLVTHAEAVADGLKRYFPGLRCRKAGHLSERFVSSGNCITCVGIGATAWQKANPAKAVLKSQRYQKAHPERPLAYRRANKAKLDQQRKAWKQANPRQGASKHAEMACCASLGGSKLAQGQPRSIPRSDTDTPRSYGQRGRSPHSRRPEGAPEAAEQSLWLLPEVDQDDMDR